MASCAGRSVPVDQQEPKRTLFARLTALNTEITSRTSDNRLEVIYLQLPRLQETLENLEIDSSSQ